MSSAFQPSSVGCTYSMKIPPPGGLPVASALGLGHGDQAKRHSAINKLSNYQASNATTPQRQTSLQLVSHSSPNELGSHLFGTANLIRSGCPKPSPYRGGNIGSTEHASTTAPEKADYHSLHRRLLLTKAI